MLPATLPIFPLPNVVLFPHVFLPLHIFEPRYRSMVADALESDRLIGMALLRPGWEGDYEGRPAVFPIGCAGLITFHERLPDGRFNIVLRGVEKFRIEEEEPGRPYRLARVETMHEPLSEADRGEIRAARQQLERMLMPEPEAAPRMPPAMNDQDLINALAQYMDLEPLEKQALLEREGLLARSRSLIELLEMKMLITRHDWGKDH